MTTTLAPAPHHLTTTSPTIEPRRLTSEAHALLDQHVAKNTARAYAADLHHVADHLGLVDEEGTTDLAALYAATVDPAVIVNYLAAHVEELKATTLARRVSALAKLHATVAARSSAIDTQPTRDPAVRQALAAARRGQVELVTKRRETDPRAQVVEKAGALRAEHLHAILATTDPAVERDARDRALLVLGFLGLLRRSELVALNVEDVEVRDEGLVLTLHRSKTDQLGHGATVAIDADPLHPDRCPVAIYTAHLAHLRRQQLDHGPIFRQVSRGGRTIDERLGAQAVGRIIAARATAAGIDEATVAGMSAHSLRRGGATFLAEAGADVRELMQRGRWTTPAIALGYVEAARPFHGRRYTL